ncbi:MAG TPA: hypothetical protein PKB06_04100, partial [Actinotalea sp.]|nr:hypothetical protein [Actinotalea sp.]
SAQWAALGGTGRADRALALAVGPGSLEVAPGGPLHGVVRQAGFRRGVVELVVDVAGLGEVTVVERLEGRVGVDDLPHAGEAVRLRPLPGGVAAVG